MDWPGLLKWSLKHTDGTKPSEIPSITDEQRKWLDEVFQSLTIDEVAEMRSILLKLDSIVGDQAQKDQCLEMLDQLMELICGLDNGMNFCKIGGVFSMFEYATNPQIDQEVRSVCFTLLSECSQNNHFVQDAMSKAQFWKITSVVEDKSVSQELRLRAVGALSSILKGNNLTNKRLFLHYNGLDFLLETIRVHVGDDKILARLLSLLADLLTYDKFLHLDLLRVEDEDMHVSKAIEDQQLVHFKHICSKSEKRITEIFKMLSKHIFEDCCMKKSHLRFSYFSSLRHHIVNCRAIENFEKSTWADFGCNMRNFLGKLEALLSEDEFYSMEVSKVKEILLIIE
jgi:hypothetical protein